MKVACVILAHRLPRQVGRLVSTLRHPWLRVYLHVDRRVPLDAFAAALSQQRVDDVVLLERRASRWGGPEVVDATLDGLRRAAGDGCQYFYVISGQDFPLRPVEHLITFAEEAASRSYVAHWELPTVRWNFGGRNRTEFYSFNLLGRRETCIPRGEDISALSRRGRLINRALRARCTLLPPRRHPEYVRAHGGWSWLNLSRSAVDYILRFAEEHPDYRAYHDHSLSPDELFFQTILMGADYADRQGVVNDALRFTIWPRDSSHPRVLTEADLPAILASGDLFARKFDETLDSRVLVRLAEAIEQ